MSKFGLMIYRSKNDGPGLSPELWHDCPLDWMQCNPEVGYAQLDDFLELHADSFDLTQAGTAGTFALADGAGGIVVADAGDDDDGDGANVQFGGAEMFQLAEGKDLWFEARLKIADAHPDFFFGLAETDTTLITTGDGLTADNHLGLLSLTGDSVLLFAGSKAAAAATVAFNKGAALTADTWYKIGFKVRGTSRAYAYLNGVEQPSSLATAHLPVVATRPSLVCQASGTGQPKVHIDWRAVAQLR